MRGKKKQSKGEMPDHLELVHRQPEPLRTVERCKILQNIFNSLSGHYVVVFFMFRLLLMLLFLLLKVAVSKP